MRVECIGAPCLPKANGRRSFSRGQRGESLGGQFDDNEQVDENHITKTHKRNKMNRHYYTW